LKNQLDYPHYKTGEITKFVAENLRENYISSPNVNQLNRVSTYVERLLKTDKDSYEKLLQLLQFFSMSEIDLRQLSLILTVFDKNAVSEISYEDLVKEMSAIFFHYRHCQDIIDRVIGYLKIADPQKANRERVFSLVEFL
jgi:hypothetical protein